MLQAGILSACDSGANESTKRSLSLRDRERFAMFKTSTRIRKRMMAARQTPVLPPSAAIRHSPNLPAAPDKRKSILSTPSSNDSSKSPPSCRKRLTFAEAHDVYQIPPPSPSPEEKDALHRAAAAVAEATCAGSWHTTAQRAHAWRVVAAHLNDPALASAYKSSALRRAFATVFGTRQPARVLSAATAALKLVADTFSASGPPQSDDESDKRLCESVLGALARGDANGEEVFENVVNAMCAFRWATIFSESFYASRNGLLRQTFAMLDAPDLSLQTWRATSQLIDTLVGVEQQDGPGEKSLLRDVIGKKRLAGNGCTLEIDVKSKLQVRESDISVMLRTAERLGTIPANGEAAEAAMFALSSLTRNNPEVSAMVVLEQGASVSCFDSLHSIASRHC